jgi:hypothetical protein
VYTIRRAQMAAFQDAAGDADRELRVFDALREDHASLFGALDDEALLAFARDRIARAARHGIREPPDVLAFCRVSRRLSPVFDEHPAVAELLAAPDFQPEELETLLVERLDEFDLLQIAAMRP